ncbi:MAG: ligase-associated DNA damage response exonuclease, partial [Phaeodactylibacter sp.]|nr:ligase-associated DNA damage response exonuclease [Phaeodactylibacter sp.]
MALLEFTDKGIYCPPADVYIDPWKPVERALITHGHADHSRWGHRHYLCTESAKPVIRYRLGDVQIQTIGYGEQISHNGVRFSFHPAGHILGSAQIRVEHQGEVWVVSGDYKLEDDGLSEPFEPVPCHTFITESTFGLPVYRWKKQEEILAEINNWWRKNKAERKVSLLTAYALGKAQRLMRGLDESIGPIFTHGAIENTNRVMRRQGVRLPKAKRVSGKFKKEDYIGGMVIAPPSAINAPWMRKFSPVSIGIASGWMALRGARRRRAADRGFVLSDHADWDGLNEAITATGAERVFVTHGYTHIFTRWL